MKGREKRKGGEREKREGKKGKEREEKGGKKGVPMWGWNPQPPTLLWSPCHYHASSYHLQV